MRSTMAKLPCLCPARQTLHREVVQIVRTDHITLLDISYRDALACLEQSVGRGLPKLLVSSSFEAAAGGEADDRLKS